MTTPVSTAPGTATDLLAAAGGAVAHGSQPAAGATSDSAAGFFALVMQALQTGTPAAGTPPGEAPVPAPVPASVPASVSASVSAPEDEAQAPEQQPSTIDPTALLSLGLALPLTPVVPIAAPASASSTPAGGTATGPVQPGTTASAAATPVIDAGGQNQDPTTSDSPTSDSTDGQPSAPSAPAPVGGTAPAPSATSLPSPAIDPTANALPASAAQPTAPIAAAPAATATTAPAPVSVSDQVFGEVTSLVSRGSGTHRITMTLNPEQLGEVRVVMTVRDGAVHVRLAAGSEARASLLEGSPELSRMLTQAGATDTRVVVRELPVAAAGSSSATGNNDPGTQPGTSSQTGASANHQQDQHARTRAGQLATDGNDTPSRRLPAAGPAALRPIETVTSDRSAGLDVTM